MQQINFRTGTFLEEDSDVLKALDWFKSPEHAKSHTRRLSLQTGPRILSRIKSRDSKSKLGVEPAVTKPQKTVRRSTSDGKIIVNPEHKQHIFDVYKALREKQGLPALPMADKKEKRAGFIRKGLREKLEARANEARNKVQKQGEVAENSMTHKIKDSMELYAEKTPGTISNQVKKVKFAADI